MWDTITGEVANVTLTRKGKRRQIAICKECFALVGSASRAEEPGDVHVAYVSGFGLKPQLRL